MNDIEQVFYDEIKEKKINSRGARNRASRKKGFKGGVRFQSDNLKPSELKKLNGEVVIMSVYDTIMSKEDFNKLKIDDRKKTLAEYLKRHNRATIAQVWGMKVNSINDLAYRYGITNKRNVEDSEAKQNKIKPPKIIEAVSYEPILKEPIFKLTIRLVDNMEGSELQERIMSIITAAAKNKKYAINLELNEIS